MSVAPAARDLEVHDLDAHENALRKLGKGVCRQSGENLSRQAQMKPEQLEIQRVRREVARLETEHDILEHFRAKWTPVREKKMRQDKDLEQFRDSENRGIALDEAAAYFAMEAS